MDYSKGKIYKIYNIIDDDIYIGSTCCPLLSQRLAKHKSCINEPKRCNSKLYSKMKEIGKEHFFIELIFEYKDCENIDQLRKKEGEYIRELKPVLNKVINGRTHEEWKKDNPKRLQELSKNQYERYKEWAKENPEEAKELMKVKYQRDKENFLKSGKVREYTEEQRAKKAEYDRKRREEMGDELNRRKREQRKLKKTAFLIFLNLININNV